jgi:hypothetical protein
MSFDQKQRNVVLQKLVTFSRISGSLSLLQDNAVTTDRLQYSDPYGTHIP